jgi:putative NIF3 family GTP cyclohydrolase 1 type 2
MCTGAGASTDTIREAVTMKVDTLIVGEGPHHTAVQAEENDLVIIYAGHYATETLGVRALGDHLGEKYGVPAHFINAPTGL